MSTSRHHSGSPVGGQFAPTDRPAADPSIHLVDDPVTGRTARASELLDSTRWKVGDGGDAQPVWVLIDRQYASNPLAVGPYASHDAAEHAMTESALIDALCEEDCLDATLLDANSRDNRVDADEELEVCVIDQEDPDHTGAPSTG